MLIIGNQLVCYIKTPSKTLGGKNNDFINSVLFSRIIYYSKVSEKNNHVNA